MIRIRILHGKPIICAAPVDPRIACDWRGSCLGHREGDRPPDGQDPKRLRLNHILNLQQSRWATFTRHNAARERASRVACSALAERDRRRGLANAHVVCVGLPHHGVAVETRNFQ